MYGEGVPAAARILSDGSVSYDAILQQPAAVLAAAVIAAILTAWLNNRRSFDIGRGAFPLLLLLQSLTAGRADPRQPGPPSC